ncbi:Potassium uptake protein, integral membrane component, KtrB [Clostridiaceae bacterium JG1575]|nr:Potassium uptake protein, integral membrane component, KtrB [Clostridiaceae bacterium JG1575]
MLKTNSPNPFEGLASLEIPVTPGLEPGDGGKEPGAPRFMRVDMNPVRVLALGFLATILLGAFFLCAPFVTKTGVATPFIDALFTATSAVCVTGLTVVDTANYWNSLGQGFILLLIQIGGLGFMSFATLTAIVLGKRLGLRDRLLMREAYNAMNLQGIIRMVRYVVFFTLGVEALGALLLMTQFVPRYGWGKGISFGVFHSISAFCNAGFDLLGNYNSLTLVNDNPAIVITIMALIVVGGLGFSVWIELWSIKSIKRLSFHSKLVLGTTALLVFGGGVLFFLFEARNPATLGPMNVPNKIINALFASVTPRTAGFNTLSIPSMTPSSRLLTMIYMFIGGSPGSTAGGIKTTSFSVLFLTAYCVLKGRKDPEVFGRRIDKDTVYKAFAVVVIGLSIIFGVTLVMSFVESTKGTSLEAMVYEATSAFGTVGLSTGITPGIGTASKIALSAGMYLGRVGPITVLLALSRQKPPAKIRYPEGKILIG